MNLIIRGSFLLFLVYLLVWPSGCCSHKCKLPEKGSVKSENVAGGSNISFEGSARNAVLGAVLVRETGSPVYIEGLAEWPDDVLGKRVKAKGILKQKKLAPDPVVDEKGGVSHGMTGSVDVLEKAEWWVVESPAQ